VTSRCDEPAGESPAPVGAGAPGSRPQAGGETLQARAGCRKPLRRKQPRGPQREVNAAASSDVQRESRAGHVAAKAMFDGPVPECPSGLPGVWAVARVEGSSRNRRDPSAQPLSGQGAPYKPRAKSATVQRESEGIVVPMRPVQHNAGRGKGPCGGRVGSGGKREGMAGQDPVQPPSRALARLQRATTPTSTVGGCQASSGETNPCPYDRIHRRDVLWEAWRREIESQGRVIGHRRSCAGPTQRYDPRSGGGVMQQPERPSVSRVRENRMHGSEGGLPVTSPCRGSREAYQ
jgi:hypothetical protein